MKKRLILLLILLLKISYAYQVCDDLVYVEKNIDFIPIPDAAKTFVYDGRYQFLLEEPKILSGGVDGGVFFGYDKGKGLLFDVLVDDDLYTYKRAFKIIPKGGPIEDEDSSKAFERYFKSPLCNQDIFIYMNGSQFSDSYTVLLFKNQYSSGKENISVLIFPKDENSYGNVVRILANGYSLGEIEEILSSLTYRFVD